jgi:hypothetical protein
MHGSAAVELQREYFNVYDPSSRIGAFFRL